MVLPKNKIRNTLYLSLFFLMQTKKLKFIILGIRSDSDMYSYSFSWKVWKSAKIVASGEEIKDYLTTAVEEEGNFSTALYSITIKFISLFVCIDCQQFLLIFLYLLGIMKNIIFKTNIESAEWISTNNRWHLVTKSGKKNQL